MPPVSDMNAPPQPSKPARMSRRIGLFGKVAFVCAMISLLSVGLSTLLFQRQVQHTTELPLHSEGENLEHILSGLVLEKLNDETELVLRCQAMCRPDNNVTYIALQPRNGEAMVFQPNQWSMTVMPLPLPIAEGSGPVRMDDPWTGEEVLVFSRQVEIASVPWGRIQFGLSLEKSRMAMHESWRNLGLTAGLSAFLVVAGAFMTARRISQPVSDLSEFAKRLAGGDLSARAEIPPGDEIGDLADSMNHMATGIDQRNTELKQRASRERELGRISAAFLSADPAEMDDTFASASGRAGPGNLMWNPEPSVSFPRTGNGWNERGPGGRADINVPTENRYPATLFPGFWNS